MDHYRNAARHTGARLEFKPIGASAYDVGAYGLTDADLRRRLYVSDAEGRMVSGVDAVIALWMNFRAIVGAPGLSACPGYIKSRRSSTKVLPRRC